VLTSIYQTETSALEVSWVNSPPYSVSYNNDRE